MVGSSYYAQTRRAGLSATVVSMIPPLKLPSLCRPGIQIRHGNGNNATCQSSRMASVRSPLLRMINLRPYTRVPYRHDHSSEGLLQQSKTYYSESAALTSSGLAITNETKIAVDHGSIDMVNVRNNVDTRDHVQGIQTGDAMGKRVHAVGVAAPISSRDAIGTVFGFETMTLLQMKLLQAIEAIKAAKQRDIIVKAGSASGKTLGYLMAAIQRVMDLGLPESNR